MTRWLKVNLSKGDIKKTKGILDHVLLLLKLNFLFLKASAFGKAGPPVTFEVFF